MEGSDAVIGWIDTAQGTSSVEMYELPSSSGGSSNIISAMTPIASALTTANITLEDSQDPADPLSVYTMAFSRPLCVNGRCLSVESQSTMLLALGDEPRLSFHTTRRPFAIALSGNSDGSGLGIPTQEYRRLAHAICMLVGWGILLPLGAGVAAGLKGRLGAPLWFRIHVSLQVLGLISAIVGISIAFANFHKLSEYGTHGRLGLTVMILGVLQPLNGLIRPHKPAHGEAKSGVRCAWEVLHKGAGWLALILALPTMSRGADLLRKFTDDQYFPGAASAITAVFVVFAVIAGALAAMGYCTLLLHPMRKSTIEAGAPQLVPVHTRVPTPNRPLPPGTPTNKRYEYEAELSTTTRTVETL